MVISVAPGLSSVVVYEAGPNGNRQRHLERHGRQYRDQTVQLFLGFWQPTTAERGTMDNYFQKMAIDGQSFFNASGDSGAFTGDWPAPDDDPYITLVGGTTLATCAPGGAWLSETAWNAPDYYDATSWRLQRKLLNCSYRTLAAGHQHVRQSGLDHTAEHSGCRHGGRRYSYRGRQRPAGR